jgi:transposase
MTRRTDRKSTPIGLATYRLSVPLPAATRNALVEFAALQRISVSCALVQMLTQATPAIEQMVATIHAAQKMDETARSALVSDLEQGLSELTQASDKSSRLLAKAASGRPTDEPSQELAPLLALVAQIEHLDPELAASIRKVHAVGDLIEGLRGL